MQAANAVIRVSTLNGKWETLGVERHAGIVPENIQLQSNEWGPDTASFSLRRDPSSIWPDLLAFTPVEIEIGGKLVWDGFIVQTPTSESDGGTINVQAKGWQYHLDDDSIEKFWVHSKLSDWKDVRSFPAANLNYFRSGTNASAGDGVITLGWPDNSYIQASTIAGVVLDLGETNSATSISVTWEVPNGSTRISSSASMKVVARTANSIGDIRNGADAFTPTAMGALGTTTTTGGTWSSPKRYVLLGLEFSGVSQSAANEYAVKIKNVSLSAKTSYYSSASKVVTGVPPSDIVKDVLPLAPLLDQSTAAITDSSYKLPHVSAIDGGKTAREYISLANSYDDNSAKVVPGRQLVYGPKPVIPSTVIGVWPGSKFSDASANSGDDIYNRVVVEGTGPDDQPLRVTRSATASATEKIDLTSLLVNPTFEATSPAVSANWTATSSTFARSTTSPITGTASAQWSSITEASSVVGTIFSGCPLFVAGRAYTLTMKLNSDQPYYLYVPQIKFGDNSSASNFATSGWTADYASNGTKTLSLTWTPTANVAASSVTVQINADGAGPFLDGSGYVLRFDDINLSYAANTMIDRRGFIRKKRLQVSAPLTETTAAILGDAFLSTHSTTPLKGDVEISFGGAREYSEGTPLHPAELLLRTGEVLHLSHRVDPDTGANGRDGRIASVSYDHSTQKSKVALDSQRNRFDAFLERLSVVTGARLQK